MSDETEQLEAQNSQREGARRATLDALRSKRRAERELSVVLNEGEPPVTLLFRAMGVTEYDRLMTECPPSKDQLAQGASFDVNRFGPQLLTRVVVDPQLSNDEWKEIWNSPDWSGGEISGLYNVAMDLCNKGLNLGPIAAG